MAAEDDEKELSAELERGDHAARLLAEHFERMGGPGKVTLPNVTSSSGKIYRLTITVEINN
jgi:hypothetical protein